MSMNRTLVSAVLLLFLISGSGCALRQGASTREQANPTASASTAIKAGEDEELHLKMVQEMLDKRLYHAALAHLQALESKKGKLTNNGRYLRAEALRRIQRLTEARALYRSLLDTPLAALGHHGLGLIAAENNDDLEAAVLHFTRATELRPVDARIRNDLGYALLLQGAFDEARFQLTTALELGGDEKRTQRNLLLLHHARGEPAEARRLAEHFAIEPNEAEHLRSRGRQLREHLQRMQARTRPPPTEPDDAGAAAPMSQETPVPDESANSANPAAEIEAADATGAAAFATGTVDMESPENDPTALGAETNADPDPGNEPLTVPATDAN